MCLDYEGPNDLLAGCCYELKTVETARLVSGPHAREDTYLFGPFFNSGKVPVHYCQVAQNRIR